MPVYLMERESIRLFNNGFSILVECCGSAGQIGCLAIMNAAGHACLQPAALRVIPAPPFSTLHVEQRILPLSGGAGPWGYLDGKQPGLQGYCFCA